MAKTKASRAVTFLKRRGVNFEIVTYDHREKGAAAAAAATGFPLSSTVKTLVAEVAGTGPVLALMPGDRELSLKLLAKAFAGKRATMADPAAAERLTGYLVGGISPFGVRKPLPAAMEADLLNRDRVLINGGGRGLMLRMKPDDIAAVLNCRTVRLIQE
ncbi:MAG: YbaK/EbsC family protein [Desulfococcaceae bacterium]